MEHNVAEAIRTKVLASETGAVHWNKERVWQSIEFQPAKNRRPIFYYGAAACVVLALLVFLNPFPFRQRTLDKRIATLEKLIDRKLSEQVRSASESLAVIVTEVKCPPEKKIDSPEKARNGVVVLQVTGTPDTTLLKIKTVADSPVFAVGVTMNSEGELPIANAEPVKIITAVLGVVPSPEKPVVRRKKKNSKFMIKLAPDPNSIAASTDENQFFTARLNQKK